MTCPAFRQELRSGELSAEALAHMRACASCLETAVASNPDNLFRSLGGGEILPHDGVDSFVAGVVHEVHLRTTERSMERRSRFTPAARWAAAAALTIVVGGITWTTQDREPVISGRSALRAPTPISQPANLQIIESYEEAGAMLVELPAQEGDDIRVVMIFDETLPVDL